MNFSKFENTGLVNFMRLLKRKFFGTPEAPIRATPSREMLGFYGEFIKPGAVCFDVGANVGNRADAFLALNASKVICVEPQQHCVEILRQHFKRENRVVIVASALGEADGTGEIHICKDSPVLSTMSSKMMDSSRFTKDYKWQNTQQVKITTLEKLISQFGRPYFCKIDVEGFEVSVLKGLKSVIPYISFEFAKELQPEAKICVAHLISLGYSEFNFSSGESMLYHGDWSDSETLWERMAEETDPLLWGDIYARKFD